MQLEDGEISDTEDEINPYTPLARPPEPAPQKLVADEDFEFEDKPLSKFGSDSDSDEPSPCKMLRVDPARNKYSIWSKDPNDLLTDLMTQVGVEKPEYDRNVENYPLPPMNERKSHTERRKRKMPKDPLHPDCSGKELECLTVNELNSFEDVANEIAQKLDESNAELVMKMVIILGKEKAISLYEKTRNIEREGGMLVLSGNRKRTSGGIFIFLVRSDEDISDSQKSEIFDDNSINIIKKKTKRKKSKKKKKIEPAILSNPPPSPNLEADATLPDLPLRRDLITYEDFF